MSGIMEDHESMRDAAIQIAVQAGVLRYCSIHSDVLLEGNEDIEEAYKLGNTQFSAGKLKNVFDSRREMTDLIKDVVADHSADECGSCAKWRDS